MRPSQMLSACDAPDGSLGLQQPLPPLRRSRGYSSHWSSPGGEDGARCQPSDDGKARLQSIQWEQDFRLGLIGTEHQELDRPMAELATMLESLSAELAGPIEEAHALQKQEALDLRERLSNIRLGNKYLWDVLKAVSVTLTTLQVEVQALQDGVGEQ
mmetsp:Transcript_82437/g.229750  ORF Transcript_82437/g.229750 Transcript_82437/m.229750 type:complete len:157 (-) Transcript_82437:89-559(-)|eukprot:CAMPEP_0117525400 /NCGR_PEP_ID=MMETSP0784-20121206/35750_1 /TAXON_ID=39447 /ORGANISM="" /LENGTH=156 /DNA_ID=CAMNT_0005321595 /DNA_START=29 /DNA_END=499 /DNA_ORIENTATION=+